MKHYFDLVYFGLLTVPIAIVAIRRHSNLGGVILLTLLLSPTGIGWLIAFWYALKGQRRVGRPAVRSYKCQLQVRRRRRTSDHLLQSWVLSKAAKVPFGVAYIWHELF